MMFEIYNADQYLTRGRKGGWVLGFRFWVFSLFKIEETVFVDSRLTGPTRQTCQTNW